MTQQIKVVMLTHDYLPKGGGIETQLASMIPILQSDYETQIHVITRKYPHLLSYEKIEDVQVHRMQLTGGKALASVSYTMRSLLKINEIRPDIIHAHSFISPTTTALLSKLVNRIPIILTAHRSGYLGDIQRLMRRKFGKQQMQWMRERVNSFVAISQEISQELQDVAVPNSKICYIPNAVNTNHFVRTEPTLKKQLRQELGIQADIPVIIFTGRLEPEKRVNHLINIWDSIREQHPDALLYILGTGQQYDDLKQMAGDGVVFTGRVSEVSKYLQSADIFVLPSVAEGLSVSMLEAMACGLPVVVTNVGGAPDVITHMQNGFLITPDDIDALQDTLLSLLNNSDLQDKIGKVARQHILDNFQIDTIAKKWRKLYEDVLS